MAQQIFRDDAFRQVSRPGRKERDLHRGVVHILGISAVAFAPDAMVPHVHAVVGGEDHQSVVPETGGFQLVQKLPDACVHGADGGVVAG